MFEECDDSSNWQKWMVAYFIVSARFTGKFGLVFVLTQENRFHSTANRKSIGSSKNRTRNFEKSPPFERSAYFYVTFTGNFERFSVLWLWKKFYETLFKKLEHRFLVESAKIKTATFPYKTALSKHA